MRVIRGDTRSLDNGSREILLEPLEIPLLKATAQPSMLALARGRWRKR